MQLVHLLIVAFLVTQLSPLLSQEVNQLKLVEGIVMFNTDEVHSSIPEDVVFIPCKIDISKSLQENVKACLEANNVGYYMYFQNMRHTQVSVRRRLAKIDNIDTTRYLIRSSLGQSCALMGLDTLSVDNFPRAMPVNNSPCQIFVSCGGIIFNEAMIESYKKGTSLTDSLLLSCQIDIGNKKNNLNYHQYYYDVLVFGMRLAFLPIVLNK